VKASLGPSNVASNARNDNLTQESDASVDDFLASVDHAGRVADCRLVMNIMGEVTGLPPKMWGDSLIGFGRYHYRYDSGREGDFFVVGISPRKANLVCYIMPGFKAFPELMGQLGTYKTGVSCLYLGRLKNVNLDVLRTLIEGSVEKMKQLYPNAIATAADLD